MKKLLILLAISLSPVVSSAQQKGSYTILGTMSNDSLRNTPQRIKKVYLAHNVGGEILTIDSAVVKNKKFTFKGTAPKHTGVYYISGFDNGMIQVFVEPGQIVIDPFNAKFPAGAKVHGTSANDTYTEYTQLIEKQNDVAVARMKSAYNNLRGKLKNDNEFMPYQSAVFNSNTLSYKTMAMNFIARHYDSPVSLYIIRYELQAWFTPKYIERNLLRSLAPQLKSHPMYKEISNMVKAASIKVGSEGPDFEAQTPEGKDLSLSSLRGKYVLLDFWASWCAPCRREFPFMKQALALSEKHDNFVILSYSIDSKKTDWVDCIKKNALTHQHWIHVSTLKGWNSDASKLYKVEAVPRTVLLNPKGEIVAFDLRGEEMVNKIKNILEGVEVYE